MKFNSKWSIGLIGLMMVACGGRGNSNGWQGGTPKFFMSLQKYSGCAELEDDLAVKMERERAYQRSITVMYDNMATSAENQPTAQPDAAAGGSAKSSTNIQEAGVDEADYIKVGAKHIFVSNAVGIEVIDRGSMQSLGRLPIKSENLRVNMFVNDDRLIVINISEKTTVYSFSLSAGKMPKELSRLVLEGNYVDSRLSDGRLVVVLNDYMALAEDILYHRKKISIPGTKLGNIKCDDIVKPTIDIFQQEMVNIVSIDTGSDKLENAKISLVGGAGQIYMTKNHLYLGKYVGDFAYFYGDDEKIRKIVDTTMIRVIDLQNLAHGKEVGSVGRVSGYAKDQWSYKEYGSEHDILAIATTSQHSAEAWVPTNNLFVLKHKKGRLKQIGAVKGFGDTEDIRSVRYVDDMAYVVTFRQTDPLFAINLKDKTKPKIESELKIPGFSTYMHPVSETQLLGVGFDALEDGTMAWAQGVQVSLFDTSDSKNVTRTDVHVIGNRGSSSEVTGNHHAFYFDDQTKMIGLPIIELGDERDPQTYDQEVKFSGAILYQVEGDKLVEKNRLTHSELIPNECAPISTGSWWRDKTRSLDINRLFQVDGNLVTISQFGLKIHDLANPESVTKTLKFEDVTCPLPYYYYW